MHIQSCFFCDLGNWCVHCAVTYMTFDRKFYWTLGLSTRDSMVPSIANIGPSEKAHPPLTEWLIMVTKWCWGDTKTKSSRFVQFVSMSQILNIFPQQWSAYIHNIKRHTFEIVHFCASISCLKSLTYSVCDWRNEWPNDIKSNRKRRLLGNAYVKAFSYWYVVCDW